MDSLPPPPPPPSPFPSSGPTPAAAPRSSGAKWVLLGCGGCLGLIVLAALFSVGIFVVTLRVLQKTDVYGEALKRAQNSAEVQKELGTPITTGWSFSGSVKYNNGVGDASFTVPVTGPKGEATLKVEAEKKPEAAWQYDTLEVQFPDGHKVDLREAP